MHLNGISVVLESKRSAKVVAAVTFKKVKDSHFSHVALLTQRQNT
jgi:hypothetical protein